MIIEKTNKHLIIIIYLVDLMQHKTKVQDIRLLDIPFPANFGTLPEVKAEVELPGGGHDVLGGPLHGVVQAGVYNVLLRRTRHPAMMQCCNKVVHSYWNTRRT